MQDVECGNVEDFSHGDHSHWSVFLKSLMALINSAVLFLAVEVFFRVVAPLRNEWCPLLAGLNEPVDGGAGEDLL